MVHLCILYSWFRATWSIYVYSIYSLETHGPSMYSLSMVLFLCSRSDFDELLDKPEFRNVEKIKTIGATFMAASGIDL